MPEEKHKYPNYPYKEDTFYLGLTMAGAVSAGAYTGGVLDYIFEVLDKWEKAKEGNLEGVLADDVPKHKVVIDANHDLAGKDLIFDIELVEIG